MFYYILKFVKNEGGEDIYDLTIHNQAAKVKKTVKDVKYNYYSYQDKPTNQIAVMKGEKDGKKTIIYLLPTSQVTVDLNTEK